MPVNTPGSPVNLPLMKRISHLLFQFLLVLCVAGIFGCKGSGGNSSWKKIMDNETLSMAETWKSDPMGCKKVRVAPPAEAMANRFKDARLNEKQIEEMLGPAEMRHIGQEHTIVSYYFDGDCNGEGKLKEGTVYCLLQFFLGNDSKVVEMGSVVCG